MKWLNQCAHQINIIQTTDGLQKPGGWIMLMSHCWSTSQQKPKPNYDYNYKKAIHFPYMKAVLVDLIMSVA